MPKVLNIGILAHVDAGKTSITEQLLFAAGVIGRTGRVDDGNTQTDSLDLERRRGITIRSAVVSFVLGDLKVNLVDTPGHPDFIAEVERVLGILDGVVLVVSAVEGVQAQTRVLMKTLRRLRLPVLLFVNKIDRAGADAPAVLAGIRRSLTPAALAVGSVAFAGTRRATVRPFPPEDPDYAAELTELLAEHDDALLERYVEGGAAELDLTVAERERALGSQVARALVCPVLFGSAVTGEGIGWLLSAIRAYLPAAEREGSGELCGEVFKVERDEAGEKVAYVRMYSGELTARAAVALHPPEHGRPDDGTGGSGVRDGKVTAVGVFEHGAVTRAVVGARGGPSDGVAGGAMAGDIAKLKGLQKVRIGDQVRAPEAGPAQRAGAAGTRHFAPPSLAAVAVAADRADQHRLYLALRQLAEQDPLIGVGRDELRHEVSVRLYGEVQKEVIRDTLLAEFGIEVGFEETTPIYRERPEGAGSALDAMGVDRRNPFLATVGIRIEPADPGRGVVYRPTAGRGSVPQAFLKAIEESARSTLRQGMHGWEVTDCVVTVTHAEHAPPTSAAGDFRNLTPLVLMDALRRAGTKVCEPIRNFWLEVPEDTLGRTFQALLKAGAKVAASRAGKGTSLLEGSIPAGMLHEFERRLPGLTRGEGVLTGEFGGYEPLPAGDVPTCHRRDNNPLDRKEYLQKLGR